MLTLLVIYVQYAPSKYPDAFNNLKKYISNITLCKVVYVIVDNYNVRNKPKTNGNVISISGDNTEREFSGWQKGIDFATQNNLKYDLILLSNEAFEAYGKSFLCDYANIWLLIKAKLFNCAIGRIDSLGDELSLYNYSINQWICTSCILLSRSAIQGLKSVISVDTKAANDFFFKELQISTLFEDNIVKSMDNNGKFEICIGISERFWPPEEQFLLSVESNKTFIPKQQNIGEDTRELSVFIENIFIDDKPICESSYLSGIHPKENNGWWMSKKLYVKISRDGFNKKDLKIVGFLNPKVCSEVFYNNLYLTIALQNPFFKKDAPICDNYKRHIIEWLTVRWHSKFVIENNYDLFKTKSKAIFNESLLTARLMHNGVKICNYGSKKYY